MKAFIYICSEEYLPYAKVLHDSLKIHSPQTKQILYFLGTNSPSWADEIVYISSWKTIYSNKLTHICSLRARVVLDAFNKGYTKVVFLGAKVEFFSSPDEVFTLLDEHQAVATPHLLEPLPEDGCFPSNASVSFTGHISTDCVAFAHSPQTRAFLTWQDAIMKTSCETTNHTYLDQSWLNFLPSFVDNVLVWRHSGWNVAFWNATQRQLSKSGEDYIVKSDSSWQPLVCFQYSGLLLDNPARISSHQNREVATGDYLEFLENYIRKL